MATLVRSDRKLTAEVAKPNDYNQRHNKFSFGNKSSKSCSNPDDKPSCEEEKDHYDGTPGSLSLESCNDEVLTQTSEEVDQSKVTSKLLAIGLAMALFYFKISCLV